MIQPSVQVASKVWNEGSCLDWIVFMVQRRRKMAGKGPNILEITPEDLPAEAKCYFSRDPHPIPTLSRPHEISRFGLLCFEREQGLTLLFTPPFSPMVMISHK